ncbi:MAG: hypothetical protein Kapaf2KO_13400 [Candidatus Kapaibacteriales bacterium]
MNPNTTLNNYYNLYDFLFLSVSFKLDNGGNLMKTTFFIALLALIMGCGDDTLSTNCPANYDPVLGNDGKIYGNGCEANREGADVVDNVNSFYWDQTQCADPWQIDNFSKPDVEFLRDYLLASDIKVYDLRKIEGTDLDVTCEACGCGTGFRFVFLAKEGDGSTLLSEGFKNYYE